MIILCASIEDTGLDIVSTHTSSCIASHSSLVVIEQFEDELNVISIG
jgi:hypothetical protein